jgi:aminoglycoside phosphotransferase (APT) family kinase protein
MTDQGLPSEVTEWVVATTGGTITRLERHVARREAWVVDATLPDGEVVEGFLRLERTPTPDDPWSLGKETRIVQALAGTGVPVPKILGRSDSPSITLFERVAGRSDLPAVDAPQQRKVMEDFIGIVAQLHQLDVDALGLPELPRPTTPQECALGEVDLILQRYAGFLADYHDPLLSFALRWLRSEVPKEVARVSLVQGDTGPVNFLFDGDAVSAVIDWEWGHLGDPMEDLGNICVREFWNPSGGLDGLFRRYEELSGIPYSPAAARYYRVQQNVRGMVPIHLITAKPNAQEPIAWYLAYRYTGDRATAESIVEAMGLDVAPPELPEDPLDGADVLAEAARFALHQDIEPAVADPFARSRITDVDVLVRCLDRRNRMGPAIEALELDDLGQLLGARPASLAEGVADLDARIVAEDLADDAIAAYLLRRTRRDEWLWAPAVGLFPERRWSPVDE